MLDSNLGLVDPTVQIGSQGAIANRGDTVPAVVRITDNAKDLLSADFTIAYDTSRLSLSDSDVTISPYLSSQGFLLTESLDNANSIVSVHLSSSTALTDGTPDLFTLAFHVQTDALAGTLPLTIVMNGTSPSQLNHGSLELSPINGSIVVPVGVAITPDTSNTDAEGSPLTLNSSILGQTGTVTYAWTVTKDGNTYSVTNNTASTFTFVPDDNATYITTLNVNDSDGNVGNSIQTTTVNNVSPTAVLGNNGPVDEGSPATVSFSGASDPSNTDTAAG
ncbi:MAG: hypothetical protein ABSG67_10300, partial [Thermoguttaceae bacterium]